MKWRKLPTRDEGAFADHPLRVRLVYFELLRHANDDGEIVMRNESDELWVAIAHRAQGVDLTDRRLLKYAIECLLEAGDIYRRGKVYVLRDWEKSQGRKRSQLGSNASATEVELGSNSIATEVEPDRNEGPTRVEPESNTRATDAKYAESGQVALLEEKRREEKRVEKKREEEPPRQPSRPPPKPNALDALLSVFASRWQRRHGAAYQPTPGDKSQLGSLLRSFATAAEALEALPPCFDAYLADPDEFIAKQGYSLRFFATSGGVNKYRLRVSPLGERDRKNVNNLTAWAERKRVELEAKERADAQR